MAITANFINTKSFSVSTNLVSDFMAGRRIKADCAGSYKYGTVLSSLYVSPNTTVILTATSDNLTSNLTSVEYGIIGKGDNQSMPDHTHDGSEGSGSEIYSTAVEYFTLDATDISNKYIDITTTPKANNKVFIFVGGGIKGELDTDYSVSNKRISWSGKVYDGILTAGDTLSCLYWY